MPETISKEITLLFGIRRPFILSVGHLIGFRNIVELVKGFSILRNNLNYRNYDLAIVGHEQLPGYLNRIKLQIQRYRLEDTVHILGEIPHSELNILFKNCIIFIFTSTCENCPTTLIEAMSIGVPIACSCFDPMPEIASDGVYYFDPRNPLNIAQTLKKLIDDPVLREDLANRAYQISRSFPSRYEVAIKTFDVLREVALEQKKRIHVLYKKS